jgi:carboxypeptidase Q
MHRPLAVLLLLLAVPLAAQPLPDWEILGRIRDEGFHRTEVMEHARHLTDRIGARLTGSPAYAEAAEWTRERFAAWGLAEPRLETWEFGEGWSFSRAEARLVAPTVALLSALPKAWTPPTAGPLRGPALEVQIETLEQVQALAGKVAGRILVVSAPAERQDPEKPTFERHDAVTLAELVEFDVPDGTDPEARLQKMRGRRKVWRVANELFAKEGALATVEVSSFAQGAVRVEGGGNLGVPGEPLGVPGMVMAVESFDRVLRLLRHGVPVELEIDVEAGFHRETSLASNTLADLPGRDPKGEVVMAGAHLDSWHAGTGATDNTAGVAVVMEAARILKSLGTPPRRTIRFALWGGEEQAFLGSRAHVARHFAERPEPTDPDELALPARFRRQTWPVTPKPEHAKLAAYFNVDSGSGRLRGLYAQENLGARALFERWLAPLADLGAATVTLENIGGTDHLPFDRAGLPGFHFIQDHRDYWTRTHHTQLDTYDHLDREDLMQAAVVLASVLWQAAEEPGSFPRKPMPQGPPGARPDAAVKPAAALR